MHFKFKYSFLFFFIFFLFFFFFFLIDQPIWQKQLNQMYLNMFKTSFGAAKMALKCLFIHVLEKGIFLPLFVNPT